MAFEVKKATEACVEWIREFFEKNGDGNVWLATTKTVPLWQHFAWKRSAKTVSSAY